MCNYNWSMWEQVGTGISPRHILGSKIAKGLQSVKYSLLQYPHEEKMKKKSKYFLNFFLVPGKSHSAEKCRRVPQKNLINLYLSSASRSSVAFSVVSSSQLIKLIKSVSSLVLKKGKVTAIGCLFLRKSAD